MKQVAVVLSGCGFKDGSEIQEAVSVLIHLSRVGARYHCFAPDKPQAGTVDHATGKPEAAARNCLSESARISRGEISPLSRLDADAFDAVVFPGGFGAAKNLCTFAAEGPECTVDPEVTRVIRAFHAARKPIGLCCIAPVLAAKVLGTAQGGPGCTVTIGDDPGTAKAIAAMGSRNAPKAVTEAVTDASNRLVSTPAYMCDATPDKVFEGIGRMVDGMVALQGR
jgi:enhancing lycopene biosynthesis protein 2